MISQLEIHHLRTLSTLFKYGTLSTAAEQLGLSQQAVSQQLKKLRLILGDPLFSATGQGMAPSPYARSIQPIIDSVLQQLQQLPLPADIDPRSVSRSVVISATDHAQKVVLASQLQAIRRFAPKLKLLVIPIESAGLTRRMQLGEIDLALTTAGYVPDGLLSRPLFVERYLCVTANETLRRAEPLTLQQLVEYDFVVTSPGTAGLCGSAADWFEQQGYPRHVVISSPSFLMTLELLRQTELVAFIPERMLPVPGLFEVPLQKYPPGFEVVMAWHPNAGQDPVLNWLMEQLQLVAATSMA